MPHGEFPAQGAGKNGKKKQAEADWPARQTVIATAVNSDFIEGPPAVDCFKKRDGSCLPSNPTGVALIRKGASISRVFATRNAFLDLVFYRAATGNVNRPLVEKTVESRFSVGRRGNVIVFSV
jgi:hypothetical protein